MLRLYLEHREDLLQPGTRWLHFAPEYSLLEFFEQSDGIVYRTADLDSPLADDSVDITDLPYASESFDVILCSHVLEHVDDDQLAMREMLRVLRPRGCALILAPVEKGLAMTIEDPTLTDGAERLRRFGQEDHVRLYGRDLADRLEAAGFAVEVDAAATSLAIEYAEQMRLEAADDIYVCERPVAADVA